MVDYSQCTKKIKNSQAAAHISFFHQKLCQKVLFCFFPFRVLGAWLKGFVRCVRNARNPFVALSLRVVATMCALQGISGQGTFNHSVGETLKDKVRKHEDFVG